MNTEEQKKYDLHAIQLKTLQVIELSVKLKRGLNLEDEPEPQSGLDFSLATGYSDYDEDNRLIFVEIGASIGADDDNAPFEMRVQLVGGFEVDDTRFPLVHIVHWARNNAPLVLYPYLREHVYGLSSRIGAQHPVLLPLFEVPTFRVNAPSTGS